MKKLLRLISVATILLAATSFMACSSDDDDDDSGARSVSARTSGSVVGVVLDNKGEPVEGATVTLGGKSTKTNYGGEFEITGVNPNDSKLIAAAKTVTTKTTETTDNSTATKPSVSHETTSTNTALNSNSSSTNNTVSKTGYTLTVRKDGYLPGKITGIYVTYQDTEDPEVTRANALLHGLEYDYQDILDRYAAALTNPNANNGGSVGTTATTVTTATEDTTATTTVQTGSNADRVFKDISEAISALKSLYKTGSYTEYFSDFGTTTTPLIPLDASLKGKIKLNLKTGTGTTYDGKTYTPKSNPTVHVSYNSGTFNTSNGTTDVAVNSADYTWEAKVDSDGNFVFDKCLPSGVPLSITVDSFEEKITKEGATEAEAYWFSSASQVIYAETTGATANSTTTTVTTTNTNNPDGSTTTKTEEIVARDASITSITLGSKDANEKSYLIMLFAQNDKVWVTKTNVEPTANGTLLTKNDALTFTFNKAMKKVGATAAGITNLAKDAYTATLSDDKKTVTFTPNIGYWILSGTSQSVTLTVEAEDGATTLLKRTFPVYFDNKVWVSVKDLSYNDYNDLRKLSDPIVLVFSKPMNEKIAVNLTNNKTAYTEKWNEADADKGIEANTELTLTPDAKVGYWDIGSEKTIDITVADAYANSKDSYINTFGYWKVGADTTGSKLTVNFDNYNDVTIAKTDKGFTATFAKAIKAQTESELKKNLTVYNVGASYEESYNKSGTALTDVVLALSDDGTTITVTPQNTEFANYGYYALSFADGKFIAKTGERIPRKPATTKTVESFETGKLSTPFVTTFTLGTEFKYTAVTVVDKLPESALASRAIYVDNDKYLKITFNKAVRSSKLSILASKTATAPATPNVTNYIDGNDVYLPLASRSDDDVVIVKGNVLATNGDKWTLGAEGFDTLYKVNKLSYQMVATSLYTVKKAIAEGAAATAGNDALVNKIAPADTTITFTFDQNVEGATWTAEFYDSDNVKYKNLDQTPYAATAAAAGKVVTVTLSGKDRDFNKTYYLSLKATKGTGDDVVVLYDSSKAASSYGPLPGRAASSTATLDSAIIADVAIGSTSTGSTPAPVVTTTQKYIHVDTKSEYEVAGLDNLYVVEASNNKASKTTDVKDFAKSNASPIVLEFSEDITGFTGILATGKFYTGANDASSSATNWLTKDDVDVSKTYASKADVKGKVITITPTYAFTTGAKVYPVVFNKDGKRIALKKVVDAANAATFLGNDGYVAAELTWGNDNKADKATNELFNKTTSTKLVVTNFDKANVGNGSDLYFSFKAIHSETSTATTPEYGEYTLYKKVKGINADAAVWKKLSTYKLSDNSLKSVDSKKLETVNDKVNATKTERVDSVKTATANAFALAGLDACIQTSADADEFNFSETAEYKVVCAIDNVEIHSNIVTVTDKKVYVKLTKSDGTTEFGTFNKDNVVEIKDPAYATEYAWADKEFKVIGVGYIKSVTVTGTKGTVSGVAGNDDGRIGGKATFEAKVENDNTWKVTGKPNGTTVTDVFAAEGDTITIKVTDAKDVPTTYTIKFAK